MPNWNCSQLFPLPRLSVCVCVTHVGVHLCGSGPGSPQRQEYDLVLSVELHGAPSLSRWIEIIPNTSTPHQVSVLRAQRSTLLLRRRFQWKQARGSNVVYRAGLVRVAKYCVPKVQIS